MTEIPLAAPPPVAAASDGQPADQIQLTFAGPASQRRWTVLIRLILAIPQTVVVAVLGIVAYLVAIIGWFAALALGRLPAWAADYLTGWLHAWTRLAAYTWLLTDRYPPFSVSDAGYPVRLAAAPGRLNRFAVFFRIILVLPAALVAGFAADGLSTIALFVIWLIVLISGRMPDPLHQAIAAILRLQARYYGYLLLLTGTYPWWGLFGDQPDTAAPAPAAAGAPEVPGPAAPPPGDAPPAGPPGDGTAAAPALGDAPPADAAPADALPADAPPAAPPPGSSAPAAGEPGSARPAGEGAGAAGPGALPLPPPAWRLILSSGARNLVVMFLALGVLVAAGEGIVTGLRLGTGLSTVAQRANAVRVVSRAHSTLSVTMTSLQQQVSACASNLGCVTRQEVKASRAFSSFNSALTATAMPDSASSSAAARVGRDAARVAGDFRRLSTATTVAQYQQTLAGLGLQQALVQFDTDYQRLGVALRVVKR